MTDYPDHPATYFSELCRAMMMLAEIPNSVFIGQAVGCGGTAMSRTLEGVPAAKRIELPVFEETQCGMATGIALAGGLPICIYPRWNFLLLATNQLVNHLDKISIYSNGGYKPKVIIRVGVPTSDPLDPGSQHMGNFSHAFELMLKTVYIKELHGGGDIVRSYKDAVARDGSTIIVEHTKYYA